MTFLVRITCLIAVSTVFEASAQQNQGIPLNSIIHERPDTTTNKAPALARKSVPQKDLPDVLEELFDSNTSTQVDSIGSKPQISIVPAIGYTLVTSFAVVISGNVAFRAGPLSRISTIVASASFTEKKQVIIPLQTNFWTKDNNYDILGNYSYLKYPQSTYGLGSNSSISNEDHMKYSMVQFYETVLRHISGNIYAGIGYDFDDHWDISQKGNHNGLVSDYTRYGTAGRTISSGLTINGLLDSRDNAINPLKGVYIGVQLRNAAKTFGSTGNWNSLIIDVRKYIKLPQNSDNVLALWSYDWLTLSGKPPYLDLPATQWDPNFATGRGYIQGRFRGSQMVYVESEYRFKITANGVLGGAAFVNAQSLSAGPGTSLQSVQPGYGPGLRVKLNKVSNTNIRIDYGFGSQGSKGLFISIGEAF